MKKKRLIFISKIEKKKKNATIQRNMFFHYDFNFKLFVFSSKINGLFDNCFLELFFIV